MDRLGVVVDRVVAEGDPVAAEEDPAADAEVEADGGGLVDDHDAEPVGVVEDLLGVGVVRGAEGVGAQPAEQREVVDHRGGVVALASDRVVLVHAEALEVEGLAVDQEPGAVDPDGADADRQAVAVDDAGRRRRGRPAGRRGRRPRAARAWASATRSSVDCAARLGDQLAVLVAQLDPDRRAGLAGDRRRCSGRCRCRPSRSVTTVMSSMWVERRGAQPDAAVEAAVVEEVVVVVQLLAAVGAVVTMPGGIDCHVSSLFTDDRDPVFVTRSDEMR